MISFNNTTLAQNNDENTIIIDSLNEKDVIIKSTLITEYILSTPLEDITNDDLFIKRHWDPEEILNFIYAIQTHARNTYDRGLMDECEEQENYWRKLLYNNWDVYEISETDQVYEPNNIDDETHPPSHPTIESPQNVPHIITRFTNSLSQLQSQSQSQSQTPHNNQEVSQQFRQYYDSLIHPEKRENIETFNIEPYIVSNRNTNSESSIITTNIEYVSTCDNISI